MNERIKEIARRSGATDQNGSMATTVFCFTEMELDRFAELIVRECCDWIDGSPSTDAGQLLLTKSFIIANLKGHFGVEE